MHSYQVRPGYVLVLQWNLPFEILDPTLGTHAYPALIVASGLLLHVPLKYTQINFGAHSPVITNENIGITIVMVFSHIGMIYVTYFVSTKD